MDNISDLLVCHHDDNNYDLLVPRYSALAVHGNVPTRIQKLLNPGIKVIPEHEVEEVDVVEIHDDQPMSNYVSLLVFKHCPKGSGRPKKTREGVPTFKKPKNTSKRVLEHDEKDDASLPPPKKR